MSDTQQQNGGSVLALMEVAPEQIHFYGGAPRRDHRGLR